ncbi:hypothetical protein OESDEN_12176 [Oesophagostomum dentatum]|uniref:Transposable element Tc3 transposase-like DNA-binding HTH domain-containing protein n=1 Tax=Oesophagostomum dentatum TaxID=61180 RepID=A0A0B1SSV7_OESDE|nr:hypothetical protein OESDEN_12176 [Oesophagostomum dentatum]
MYRGLLKLGSSQSVKSRRPAVQRIRERSQTLAPHQAGHSVCFIASQLERSRPVVSNFLDNPDSCGQRTSPARHHVISKREQRQILKEVTNATTSVSDIRANLDVAASKTTVWRVVNANPNIRREAVRKAPRLAARHKAVRLHFASENTERDWTKNLVGSTRRRLFEVGTRLVY